MFLARNIKLLKWLIMPVVIFYFSCRHGGPRISVQAGIHQGAGLYCKRKEKEERGGGKTEQD